MVMLDGFCTFTMADLPGMCRRLAFARSIGLSLPALTIVPKLRSTDKAVSGRPGKVGGSVNVRSQFRKSRWMTRT